MKNSKRGISLIVLVITIIVIIILAAAVILTLNNNNPIAEANSARYASDAANMQAIFTNVVAKVMAANQAVCSINIPDSKTELDITAPGTAINYTLTNASNSANSSGEIIFAKVGNDASATKWYTGKALPVYPAGGYTWNVDTEGNITLKFGTGDTAKVYPSR